MKIKNTRDIKTYTLSRVHIACKNSKIIRTGYRLGKKGAEPVFEIKDIYMTNKSAGTKKAIKAVIKEKGICAPIFAGLGAFIGTFCTIVPGSGLVGAIGGYFFGHGIDICSKKIYKLISRLAKK